MHAGKLVLNLEGSVLKHCFHTLFLLLSAIRPSHAQVERPALTGIAVIEIQVGDIKKSTIFYSDILGYRAVPVAMVAATGPRWLEFFVNSTQSIRIRGGLPAGQDERLLSVGFRTTNAEMLRQYLQSKAVEVPSSIIITASGEKWFEVKDPGNHMIKFIESSPVKLTTISQQPVSKSILHAGITVADTAATNSFYRDVLGFSETWRGGATDSVTSWINMHLPESTNYLEYMLVSGAVNRQQLGNLHHVALMVPDMQQALDVLRQHTAITKYPVAAPRVGRNKRWQLNLFDPDGTRIELMEPFPMR